MSNTTVNTNTSPSTTPTLPFSTCYINDPATIITTTIHCIIITTALLGNGLALFIFKPRRYGNKQATHDILIWYLSLFDMTGTITVIVEVYQSLTCYTHWPFGWLGCKVLYPCYYFSINMSVCMLLLISLDRYRLLVTPHKHKFTASHIHRAVLVSVIISIALQWYQVVTLNIKTSHKNNFIGNYSMNSNVSSTYFNHANNYNNSTQRDTTWSIGTLEANIKAHKMILPKTNKNLSSSAKIFSESANALSNISMTAHISGRLNNMSYAAVSYCDQKKGQMLYALPRTLTLLLRDVGFLLVFTFTTRTISRANVIIYLDALVNRNKQSMLMTKRARGPGFGMNEKGDGAEGLKDTEDRERRQRARVRRVVNMIRVMGITFALLVLPLDTMECVLLVSRLLPEAYIIKIVPGVIILDAILSTLQMCNSIANCFIYAKMHRHYRLHLKRLQILTWLTGKQSATSQTLETSSCSNKDESVMLMGKIKN